MQLAVSDDDLFLRHAAPFGHPEREARLHAARRGVVSARAELESVAGFEFVELPARDASSDELGLVHSPDHIELISSTAGKRGRISSG